MRSWKERREHHLLSPDSFSFVASVFWVWFAAFFATRLLHQVCGRNHLSDGRPEGRQPHLVTTHLRGPSERKASAASGLDYQEASQARDRSRPSEKRTATAPPLDPVDSCGAASRHRCRIARNRSARSLDRILHQHWDAGSIWVNRMLQLQPREHRPRPMFLARPPHDMSAILPWPTSG